MLAGTSGQGEVAKWKGWLWRIRRNSLVDGTVMSHRGFDTPKA
jgi:hypothetical protein